MADDIIASAWVQIKALTNNFGRDVQAAVNGQTAGVTASVSVGADTTDAQTAIDELRARLDALSSSSGDVTVGADTTDADAKIDELRARLDALSGQSGTVDVKADTGDTTAKIDEIRAELDELDHKSANPKVDVDKSGFDAGISSILSGLGGLSPAAGGASAGVMSAIGPMIAGIGALGPAAVGMAAVAGGALATLPAMAAGAASGFGALYLATNQLMPAISELMNPTQQTGRAIGSTALASLNAAHAMSQATDAIATAQQGVASAVQAGAAAQVTSARAVAAAQQTLTNAVQTASNDQINAQQSLQSAEQAVGAARVAAAKSVAAAQQTLATAVQTASNDQVTAQQSLQSAEQAVSAARVAAAQQVTAAQQSVVTAQQGLAAADYTEQQARDSLNQSYEAATEALQNLQIQVEDGALSQQQAALNVTVAEQKLQATQANPASTLLQREQAKLTYELAVQHVKDLQVQQGQLKENYAEAAKAGVNGSTQVTTAQHNLQTAIQSTGNAQQALARAQLAVTTAQQTGAANIAKAEQALADTQRTNSIQRQRDLQAVSTAQANVTAAEQTGTANIAKAEQSLANTQRQNAMQRQKDLQAITTAQQGVTVAQQNAAASQLASSQRIATAEAGVAKAIANRNFLSQQQQLTAAQTAAQTQQHMTKLQYAMSQLTPAGVTFVNFFKNHMLPTINSMQDSVQAIVLPDVTKALTDAEPAWKIFQGSILDSAKMIGGLLLTLGQFAGSQQGLKDITALFKSGDQFMGKLGAAAVKFLEGLANLGPLAAPLLSQMGDGLLKMAQAFLNWTNSKSATDFFAYIAQVGPGVVGVLESLVGDVLSILKDVAPYAATALSQLKAVLDWIPGLASAIAPLFGLVQALLGPLIAAIGPLLAPLEAIFKILVAALIQLVQQVLPPFLAFLDKIIIPVLGWIAAFGKLHPAILLAAAAIGVFALVFTPLLGFFGAAVAAAILVALAAEEIRKHWAGISGFFVGVWDAVKKAFLDAWNIIESDASTFVDFFTTTIPAAFDTAKTDIVRALDDVWSFVKTWGPLVLVAFAPFIGIPLLIWQHWSTIKGYVTQAWNAVVNFLTPALSDFAAFFDGVWHGIETAFQAQWDAIRWVATTAWRLLTDFFTSQLQAFAAFFGWIWRGIRDAFSVVWAGIKTVAVDAWDWISGFFGQQFAAYAAFFSWIWHGIETVFSTVWGGIKSAASTIWGDIKSFYGGAFTTFHGDFTKAWDAVGAVFTSVWDGIAGAASATWNTITGYFTDGINSVIKLVNDFIGLLNHIPGVKLPTIGTIGAPPAVGGGGGGSSMGGGGHATPALAAAGAVLPATVGAGFITNGPRAIVGEGNQAWPEYVIPTDPAHRANAHALFRDLGTQLLAAGGYMNPMRGVSGLTPLRIDEGVDYAGSGPVYAIGPGTVTMDHGSGWPGGGYVQYQLDSGADAGRLVYVAENISPLVHAGQAVTGDTPVALLHPGAPNMETGWASGNGTVSAAGAGMGEHATTFGKNFSDLLVSLGAPGGTGGAGVLGTIGRFFGGVGSAVAGFARRSVGSLVDAAAHTAGFPWHVGGPVGPIASGIADEAVQQAIDTIKGGGGKGGGIGGSAYTGGGQLDQWLSSGLSVAGKPQQWLQGMHIIAMGESGGDPNARQQIVDINSIQGDPAEGLCQLIPSTFAGNMVPGHGNIFNPVDNSAASANYIAGRYGTVYQTPGVLSEAAGGPYRGYDSGGWLHPGTLGVNRTSGREAVMPEDIMHKTIVNAVAGGNRDLLSEIADYLHVIAGNTAGRVYAGPTYA